MNLKNKDKIPVSTHLRPETMERLKAMLRAENESAELSENPPLSMRRLCSRILFEAAQEFQTNQGNISPVVPTPSKRNVSPKAREILNRLRAPEFDSDQFTIMAEKGGATTKTAIYWLYLLKKADLIKKIGKGKYIKT